MAGRVTAAASRGAARAQAGWQGRVSRPHDRAGCGLPVGRMYPRDRKIWTLLKFGHSKFTRAVSGPLEHSRTARGPREPRSALLGHARPCSTTLGRPLEAFGPVRPARWARSGERPAARARAAAKPSRLNKCARNRYQRRVHFGWS